MEKVMGKAIEIAQRMEERQGEGDDKIKKDFLDVLLEYQGNGNEETLKISEEDLNKFILVFLN